jgi:hypothetical protein
VVGVAQRPKASGCGPEDRGFKSLHPPQNHSNFQGSIHVWFVQISFKFKGIF